VVAAAVILPKSFPLDVLDDSKKLTDAKRRTLRVLIEQKAIDYAVSYCNPAQIDTLNILWASVKAMHKSIDKLKKNPGHILVDGNRFKPYHKIPFTTVVGGDAKYASIAAASILAKTYRDDFMLAAHTRYPQYGWDANKGYPTRFHKEALISHGITPMHRKSFKLLPEAELFTK